MYLSIPFWLILAEITKNIPLFSIDKCTQCMIALAQMNEIQTRIAGLEAKKWTLAAIADELEAHRNTVGMWKAGTRYPRPDKPIIDALDHLLQRKRVPKMKRYEEGSRQQKAVNDGV